VLEPSSVDHDPYCGLSVDLEQLLIADGVDARAHVTKRGELGAICFRVTAFRDRGFLVGFDPQPDNPYHGSVWEQAEKQARLTKGTRKALLREASWFIEIAGTSIFTD
jgi:hypothetical protein